MAKPSKQTAARKRELATRILTLAGKQGIADHDLAEIIGIEASNLPRWRDGSQIGVAEARLNRALDTLSGGIKWGDPAPKPTPTPAKAAKAVDRLESVTLCLDVRLSDLSTGEIAGLVQSLLAELQRRGSGA